MNIDRHIAAIPSQSAQDRARVRANAEGWLASDEPAKREAATQLIAALDAHEESSAAAMRERLQGQPLASRIVEAFRAKPMTDHERKVIQVLLDRPGSTTTELTRAAGLGNNMVWQMHFGVLCKERQAWLWPAPDAVTRDGKFFSGILADADAENRFTLKPEVVEALRELGLKAAKA